MNPIQRWRRWRRRNTGKRPMYPQWSMSTGEFRITYCGYLGSLAVAFRTPEELAEWVAQNPGATFDAIVAE